MTNHPEVLARMILTTAAPWPCRETGQRQLAYVASKCCAHVDVIECLDGLAVCTRCEATIDPTAPSFDCTPDE